MSTSKQQAVSRVQHDADTEYPLSTTLIELVADVAGTRPEELPPLYDYIDPEALDTLCAPGQNNAVERLSFEFAGFPVTVYAGGKIVVHPRE